MGTIGLVARRDLGQRWRRLLVLTVLIGAAGAFTLAMVAGARRTSTALDRFQQQSRSADIELAADTTPAQVEQLADVDGVAGIAVLEAFGLIIPAAPDFQAIGAATDNRFGDVVDRGRIVAGRAPNPAAADEITIGEGLAARLGLAVGDHLDVESFSPEQIAAILSGTADVGPRAGPVVRLRVVGIVRRPLDLGDPTASGGLLVLTPEFARTYADQIGVFGSRVRIRTEHGAADVPEVLAASRQILGDSQFIAQGLAVDTQGARNTIDVLASALWIGAAVAALAGIVTIGIVLTREISLVSVDLGTLRELGCDRRQCVIVAAVPGVLLAGGGALLAALGAIAASPLFPVGVARRADPAVGIHADWTALSLGAIGIGACVLLIVFVVSYRATRSSTPGVAGSRPARTSKVAERVAAAGVGPPVTNGVRMALERGGGRTAVPVRTGLVGAAVGTIGVAAVLVFGSSLNHLVRTPTRYGAAWDFRTMDVTPNTPCGAGDYGLAADEGIATLAEVCVQNVQLAGRPVTGVAFTPLHGGTISPEVTAGRAPVGPGEVALGAKTLQALDKHIGDRVQVTGRDAQAEYEIVGRAIIPTLGPAQPLDDGIVFTGQGYQQLFDQNLFSRYFVGRFSAGADRAALVRRIDALPQLTATAGPSLPVEVGRLREIDWLPVALAALLGGLALLAVGQALVTAVRRRRRDLALLKTLGFDRRQVQATVAWQATTMGVVGLLVGIPIGVADRGADVAFRGRRARRLGDIDHPGLVAPRHGGGGDHARQRHRRAPRTRRGARATRRRAALGVVAARLAEPTP